MTDTSASWIWLNGRLAHAQVPHLSAYDRGFQLGDAVFEALRARRGVAVELDGHLNRLRASLQALAIALPYSDVDLAAAIEQLLAADGLDGLDPAGDAAVRLTVSRGTDYARGVSPNPGGEPSVVIQAWPHRPPTAAAVARGRRLITSSICRVPDSPMAGIKTTSRAELVYAHLEAERAGADDAIFVTTDGRITEATTANLLLISGSTCATPRLGTGLLPGTTRAWLVGHGDEVGLRMVERDLRPDDMFAADEAAICSSVGGVFPVVALDGRPIGDGRPGPRTLTMREAREAWIDTVSLRGRSGA